MEVDKAKRDQEKLRRWRLLYCKVCGMNTPHKWVGVIDHQHYTYKCVRVQCKGGNESRCIQYNGMEFN